MFGTWDPREDLYLRMECPQAELSGECPGSRGAGLRLFGGKEPRWAGRLVRVVEFVFGGKGFLSGDCEVAQGRDERWGHDIDDCYFKLLCMFC